MRTPVSAPEADRQASFMPARHPATDRTATGARAPTGGGAGALRGAFSEHALRTAFAAGPNTAAGAAGVTATVAGALVVALVRTPRATGWQ
ncbi:hypothetical protein ACFY2T_12855 [Streptomyces sp. NPDC001260]|uniref:hypothetical protein n=1 Tax=Streptomyces sp. NPDC001260 TaxID=3364551 RepID=UPI00368E751E